MKEIALIYKDWEMEIMIMQICLFMTENGLIAFKMFKENFSI